MGTGGFEGRRGLEQIPQRLVIHRVMELHFGAFDNGSEVVRRTVGGSLFQIGIASLHIGAENLGDPLRCGKVIDGLLNIVGQITAARTQVLGL